MLCKKALSWSIFTPLPTPAVAIFKHTPLLSTLTNSLPLVPQLLACLDSIERLNDFSADPDYCAGKVAVASDADGTIAKSYDLAVKEAAAGKKDSRGVEINHGFAERTTFIITPDGKIAATLAGLKPAENVEKALETVQQIATDKQAAK